MSVLTHLAAPMGEPGATRALAYILNQQPGIVRAFVKLLNPAGVAFDPRHPIESERSDDGGRTLGRPRPDMKICDDGGRTRVLIENKFWAGLTDSQPVGYLEMLPNDVSSGLLFIVPGKRVEMIWKELKTRCQEAGFDLEQGLPKEGRVRWVQAGAKTMLVTDWQNVLSVLDGGADGQEKIRGDILQFRHLVETLESFEAFPALRSDEVTNAEQAQRIINYIGLIDSICQKLQETGIEIGAAAASYNDPYFCRSLTRNYGEDHTIHAYLALTFPIWCESGGVTPLWLWVGPWSCLTRFDELEMQFEGTYTRDNDKFIPIRLKLGVERDRVVEDAVEQIRRMFEQIR